MVFPHSTVNESQGLSQVGLGPARFVHAVVHRTTVIKGVGQGDGQLGVSL